MVAPEEIIFESTAPGMFVVEVDLSRVRELRASRDEPDSSLANAAKTGVLSQWQRPEMYKMFLPFPAKVGTDHVTPAIRPAKRA